MPDHYTTVGPIIKPAATTQYEVTMNPWFPHSFVGVLPCDVDGNYDVATAGTASFKVETVNCPGLWQIPVDSVVDLTDPGDVSFAGNITRVQVTITGLTGAAYTCARVSQNMA